MKNIKKINLENEDIYLKKSKSFGWSVVRPYKIDGKIDWKNLLIGGSWIKLIMVVAAILIILGSVYEYSTAVNTANECLNQSKLMQYNFPY